MNRSTKPSKAERAENFRERLGEKDIQIDEYKVDELRKMASSFDIAGSHDMNKEELVTTINRARHNEPK